MVRHRRTKKKPYAELLVCRSCKKGYRQMEGTVVSEENGINGPDQGNGPSNGLVSADEEDDEEAVSQSSTKSTIRVKPVFDSRVCQIFSWERPSNLHQMQPRTGYLKFYVTRRNFIVRCSPPLECSTKVQSMHMYNISQHYFFFLSRNCEFSDWEPAVRGFFSVWWLAPRPIISDLRHWKTQCLRLIVHRHFTKFWCRLKFSMFSVFNSVHQNTM